MSQAQRQHPTLELMAQFDLAGLLRRIRREADLSQRELAERLGMSKSMVAAIEKGHRGLEAGVLARAADLAGFRLTLVDTTGEAVAEMSHETVRDSVGRQFPAHLDTRYGDIDWWHGDSRYSREQPSYTFDRVRETRDFWRGRLGTPDDHQLPQPGDSPAERRAARQRAARERRRRSWNCAARPVSCGNPSRSAARARRCATSWTTGPASPCTHRTAHVAATSADALLP